MSEDNVSGLVSQKSSLNALPSDESTRLMRHSAYTSSTDINKNVVTIHIDQY